MEQNVTLADFREALLGASDDGAQFALIGGLAVGAWADYFGVFDRPGETIDSKDIDLRGYKAASTLVKERLKRMGHRIATTAEVRRKEPPGLGMNYVSQVDMTGIGRVSVGVLERLPLVDSPDLPPRGFVVVTHGIPLFAPLSLMIGKLHAYTHRKAGQSDNDAKHLELLRRLLPAFMQDACERGLTEDIRERATALLEVLETWKVPFSAEELAALREELRRRAA